MKFTAGQWQLRPGVKAFYATQLFETRVTSAGLTTVALVQPRVPARVQALDATLLTAHFSSPMEDVLRVRLSHFEGVCLTGPAFELQARATPSVTVVEASEFVTITSGKLAARVAKDSLWRVDFLGDGRPLTASADRAFGYLRTSEGAVYIHEQLNLAVGELVYGLGERFTALVKNGQSVDIWNEDGGAGSDLAYKNIPFYLTNRGYGVFINHPEHVSFEVASERASRVQFSVPGESLEYFLIYGPSPKAVLEKYTALTGRPALPPAWSFGLWLSTSFTTDYSERTVTEMVEGMSVREIPLSVFHFDCLWMKDGHWIDLNWDEAQFPDAEGMLQRLKARGLHICVWINPYVAQRSRLFAEAAAQGYLLRRSGGDIWQVDTWQPGMGIIDFTHPGARAWYGEHLRALLAQGVDCFKTDFGERIPTDVVYADGSDPQKMHNFYTFLYNRTVFELLQKVRGADEAVVFARSATAGGQRFPVHWGGDNRSSFESMAESLRGGLSLGLSGFGFWSHDIGGFEGLPPAALYKRWVAFGLLSSHSRLHAMSSYRVPWAFDEEAVAVLRYFAQLKCRLMPYLFAQALSTVQTGVPMMRAMFLEFPDDPACEALERQYMLGECLLVAPVFSAAGEVSTYVPAGNWTQLLTGEVITGPRWVREIHDFMSLPLLVRPNSLIPFGSITSRPDYDYAENVRLALYALEDGALAKALVLTSQGGVALRASARREAKCIAVGVQGAGEPWELLLAGIDSVASVEGGVVRSSEQGVLITSAATEVRITLLP